MERKEKKRKGKGKEKKTRRAFKLIYPSTHQYVASLAKKFVSDHVSPSDIERMVARKFPGVDLSGKMGEIGDCLTDSQAVYAASVQRLATQDEDEYDKLRRVPSVRDPELEQDEADIDKLFEDAEVAQELLKRKIAREWESGFNPLKPKLSRPKPGTQEPWVHDAVDPGLKGRERAAEKTKNDYCGNAAKMKDISRLTLVYKDCASVLAGLNHLRHADGLECVQVKNKFAAPTPMGYRDLNVCLRLQIGNGRSHVSKRRYQTVKWKLEVGNQLGTHASTDLRGTAQC